MNIIKKTSLASGGTTEKRIAYFIVAMEREFKDLQSVFVPCHLHEIYLVFLLSQFNRYFG